MRLWRVHRFTKTSQQNSLLHSLYSTIVSVIIGERERERERSRGTHLSFRFLGNHILRGREIERERMFEGREREIKKEAQRRRELEKMMKVMMKREKGRQQ